MRTSKIYQPKQFNSFKEQLLIWSQQFDDVVFLDSNDHHSKYKNYDAVLAVDALTAIRTDYKDAFNNLQEYQSLANDWIFGYLTYDLKNATEALQSKNYDGLGFPDLYFFQPKKLFFIKDKQVDIAYLRLVEDEIEDDLKAITTIGVTGGHNKTPSCNNQVKIKLRTHKDAYYEKVATLLAHIHRGDIYEANFCQEFYAEDTAIDPVEIFLKLNNISKPPFATFLKIEDKYLLSASPERYLKKQGSKVISQPIKGTSKRSENLTEDRRLADDLARDEKERSENIMIVDLVRNDLSHTASKGSVEVEELCKVYSFLQVHQMISTVSSRIKKETHPVEVLKTTFPMGSMTGAPKISAMNIIEALEDAKRGLYSGAVGYFTPDGDFDFNVVIRSILFNESRRYLSYSVGSAITAKSDPVKEYEECLIKAKAMREVLED